MKKLLKYSVPYRYKQILKKAYYSLLDAVDFVSGKKRPFLPPRRANFVGSFDFEAVGREFFSHFVSIGGLLPYHNVLDIGSGIGRMAVPLTFYLSKEAQYFGFDIVKKGILWCEKNITSRFPNFRFIHADIKNKFYNPAGKILDNGYKFPAKEAYFDFCIATSVFTHMQKLAVERYVKETARVTKPGGKIFFTFFLIPDSAGESYTTDACDFQYNLGNTLFYSHQDCVEAEVGFREGWVKNLLSASGFREISVYPGKWKNSSNALSYQDIVTAVKS